MSFIGKTIKYVVVYPTVGLVGLGALGALINAAENTPEAIAERVAECHAEVGAKNCTDKGYKTEEYTAKLNAEYEAKKIQREEEKRIADAKKAEERQQAKERAEERTRLHAYAYSTIDTLARTLRDADSAEFRNIQVIMGQGDLQELKLVTGEVNAKNAFGAYTGFEKFVGAPGFVSLRSQMDEGEFVKFWNKEVAGSRSLATFKKFFY